jgi:hypothetical protein
MMLECGLVQGSPGGSRKNELQSAMEHMPNWGLMKIAALPAASMPAKQRAVE